jgi:hypothetical protein
MTIFGGPVPFNYISAADIQRFFHPWTQGKVALPSKFKGMHDHGALAKAPMWIEPEDDTQNSPAPAAREEAFSTLAARLAPGRRCLLL